MLCGYDQHTQLTQLRGEKACWARVFRGSPWDSIHGGVHSGENRVGRGGVRHELRGQRSRLESASGLTFKSHPGLTLLNGYTILNTVLPPKKKAFKTQTRFSDKGPSSSISSGEKRACRSSAGVEDARPGVSWTSCSVIKHT